MRYDEDKYNVQKLPNPLLLHWILNPGLAINEVILGQRIPKVTLIDKTSNASLIERTYFPCPSCGAIHSGMLWGKGNAFGHWLGYICPGCEQRIPCLWNVFSLLLLAILSPLWFPLKKIYEQKYIAYELSRYKKAEANIAQSINKFTWIKMGASFGLLMLAFFVATEYFRGGMTLDKFVFLAIVNAIGGLFFGAFMWFFMGRKKS